jgi:hypothetical protein
MFFIPEFSKNLINQILWSYCRKDIQFLVKTTNANLPNLTGFENLSGFSEVKNCPDFPIQTEYTYIYGVQKNTV